MKRIENKIKIRIVNIAIFRLEYKMNTGICAALLTAINDLRKHGILKISPIDFFNSNYLKENFERIEIIAAKPEYSYRRKIKPNFYDTGFWWSSNLITVRVNVLKEYLKELEDDNK